MTPKENIIAPRKQLPAFLLIMIMFLVVALSLFLTRYFVLKLRTEENKLAQLQQSFNNYKQLKDEQNKTPKTSASSELPYCPIASDEDIVTKDGKFYLYRHLGIYKICDQSNTESPHVIEYYESRVQKGLTLIITVYGDKMFTADLQSKTLAYISIQDFPESDRLYNSDGSIDLWLFGPREEDLNKFSPLGDKLIIGAAGCHDCQAVVKSYVLNLKTNKITELGYANGNVSWVNNNTVSWEEISFDAEQKPLGAKTKVIE